MEAWLRILCLSQGDVISASLRNPVEQWLEGFPRCVGGVCGPAFKCVGQHPEPVHEVRQLFPVLLEIEQLKPATEALAGTSLLLALYRQLCRPGRDQGCDLADGKGSSIDPRVAEHAVEVAARVVSLPGLKVWFGFGARWPLVGSGSSRRRYAH